MKKILPILVCLLPFAGPAQNYNPFKPGVMYVYSGTEPAVRQKPVLSFTCPVSHTIIIDSMYLDGNDSCYLNYEHFADYPDSTGDFCRRLNREFWFGKRLVKKPDGDFLLIALNNDSTRIKTQVSVNDTFLFLKEAAHPDSDYMAVVKSKAWENFQQTADSVITYSIIRVNAQKQLISSPSNFNELKISKQYGVVQWVSPGFAQTSAPDFCSDRPSIKPYPSSFSLSTFEVGDEFEYTYSMIFTFWVKYCYERRRVLAKVVYAQGDSVKYTFEVSKLFIPYSSARPLQKDTFYLITSPLAHAATLNRHLALNSGVNNYAFVARDSVGFGVSISGGLTPDMDSCWRPPLDGITGRAFFRPGIGLIYSVTPFWNPFQSDDAEIKELYYYKKGNITWGTSIDFSVKMGAGELSPERAIQIYPNPVRDVLTIRLFEEAKATLVIYDLLGKEITSQTLEEQTSNVDVSDLKPGSYLYELKLNSGQQVQGKLMKQ